MTGTVPPPGPPSDTPNRFARLGIWPALVIAILGVTLVLAVVECALAPRGERYGARGMSGSPGPGRHIVMREWKPRTDYVVMADANRRRFPEGRPDGRYVVSTDDDGFIMPARVHETPDLSIAFLGGSTTECLLVSPEARFPHLAAQELGQSTGLKVNGLNAARSGNNTMHSLSLLQAKILPLRPQYVILMHATNDIGVLATAGSYWPTAGSLRQTEAERISIADGLGILSRSVLPYTLQTLQSGRRQLGELFRRRAATPEPGPTRSTVDETRWARLSGDYGAALRTFVRTAKAWGIRPVLMTQVRLPQGQGPGTPDFIDAQHLERGSLDRASFDARHDAFNELIRSIAADEDALLIDLVRAREWRVEDLYDGLHFTDAGSRAVARILSTHLADDLRRRPLAMDGRGAQP